MAVAFCLAKVFVIFTICGFSSAHFDDLLDRVRLSKSNDPEVRDFLQTVLRHREDFRWIQGEASKLHREDQMLPLHGVPYKNKRAFYSTARDFPSYATYGYRMSPYKQDVPTNDAYPYEEDEGKVFDRNLYDENENEKSNFIEKPNRHYYNRGKRQTNVEILKNPDVHSEKKRKVRTINPNDFDFDRNIRNSQDTLYEADRLLNEKLRLRNLLKKGNMRFNSGDFDQNLGPLVEVISDGEKGDIDAPGNKYGFKTDMRKKKCVDNPDEHELKMENDTIETPLSEFYYSVPHDILGISQEIQMEAHALEKNCTKYKKRLARGIHLDDILQKRQKHQKPDKTIKIKIFDDGRLVKNVKKDEGSHSIVLTIKGDHSDLKGSNQPFDLSKQYINDLNRYSNKLISPSKTAFDSVKDDDTLQKIDTILRHDEATLKLNSQIPIPLKTKPTEINDIVRDNTFSEEPSHKQSRRNPSKISGFENAKEIDRSKAEELDGDGSYEYLPMPVTKSNRETFKVHDSENQSTQKHRENYFHKDKKYHVAQVDATVQNRLEDQTEPTSAAEQRELGKINNNFHQPTPTMDVITTEKMLIIPFKKKSSDYDIEDTIDLDNEEDLEKLRQMHRKFRVKESKDMIHNKEYPVQKRNYKSLDYSQSTTSLPVAIHLKNADDVLDKLKYDLEKTIKANFDKKHLPVTKVGLLTNDNFKSALLHLLDDKKNVDYRHKRDNGEDEDYEDVDKGDKNENIDESEETLRNKRNVEVESFKSRSLKSIDYSNHYSKFPTKRSLSELFGMSNDEDYSEDKVDYYDVDVKQKRSQNAVADVFASTVASKPIHSKQNSKKRNYSMFKKKPKNTRKIAKKDVQNFEEKFNLFTKNLDLFEKTDSGTKFENDEYNRNVRKVKEFENQEDDPISKNHNVLYLNVGREVRKSKPKNLFVDEITDERSKKSSEIISSNTENEEEKEKNDTGDSKQTDFILKEDSNKVDSADDGESTTNEDDLKRCDKMNMKDQKEPVTNSLNTDDSKNLEHANNSSKAETQDDDDNDSSEKTQMGNELDIIEKTQAILLHITNPPNKNDAQNSKGEFDENDDSNSRLDDEKAIKPNRDEAGLKVNHKKIYNLVDSPDEDVVGEIMRIVSKFKEKSAKSEKKQKQDKRDREEDDYVAIGAHHHVPQDKKHHAHLKNTNNCNVLKSGSDHVRIYHQKNIEEADLVAPKAVREAFVDVETEKEKYNFEAPEEEEEPFHNKRILRNGNENPLRFTPDNVESFKEIVEDSPNSDSKTPEVNIRLDSDREKRYLKHLYNSTKYTEKGKRSKRDVNDVDNIDIDNLLSPLKPSKRNKRFKNYYYNPYLYENLLRFKQDLNGSPSGSSAASPAPASPAPAASAPQQPPPAPQGAPPASSNYGMGPPGADHNATTQCTASTESTCMAEAKTDKPLCKPKKKPKKNKNDCLADETYDLRTNINKESDREQKLREQNREKLKNDRMVNKQKEKERFKNILNGHIINEIIDDFQNRLKENERLNTRFGDSIGKQCVQDQVVIIDKFREEQSKKDVKHAQLMLHQVIVMLNKIVADQVHRRTCLVLPPILHDFLSVVATPRSSTKSNQIAEGYPLPHITGSETNKFGPSGDDKQGEFLFVNSDNSQTRLSNDVTMKKKINLIKKLLNKYDHMTESCQIKVEPVKDYLYEHLTMLERLYKEKKMEEEDNICTVHPDYLKKCNSTTASTTPKSSATTPTVSTAAPSTEAAPSTAGAVTHAAPPAQRSFYQEPYQGYPLKYRYSQSKQNKGLSDKYRRLVEAADTYRRKRQIEKRLARLFGERKRKSADEKQNDAEDITDVAFESPVVYSLDE